MTDSMSLSNVFVKVGSLVVNTEGIDTVEL
jgi:hypothetical protein